MNTKIYSTVAIYGDYQGASDLHLKKTNNGTYSELFITEFLRGKRVKTKSSASSGRPCPKRRGITASHGEMCLSM